MKLFGLMIMGSSALQREKAAHVSRAFKAEYEPAIKQRDKTIAKREATISNLEIELDALRKEAAARPVLDATIEQGKRDRWRFKIMSGDDIIAMPPIRGYAEQKQAHAVLKLLSDATIKVV